MLKKLCMLNSASGDERAVREFIIEQIKDFCEYEVDNLGSIIAFKKGEKTPDKKVMFAAHMDEVGFIITDIDDEGYLSFAPVGGIDTKVVADRVLNINSVKGVVGLKPVHLLSSEERNTPLTFKDMRIDIGASDRKQAEENVSLGDFAYFESEYYELGNGLIKAKAIDDRVGCMLMIELIKSNLEYDTYFCFNVQEEVGLRGSACTSYAVQSDISVILEATTASDIDELNGSDAVCFLGSGSVVSFMDGRTIYNKELYDLAMTTANENGIKVQSKRAIAGGNDAGAIQTSGKGSKVLAISLPCRYIHSACCVANKDDIDQMRELIKALMTKIYD